MQDILQALDSGVDLLQLTGDLQHDEFPFVVNGLKGWVRWFGHYELRCGQNVP